MFIQYERRRLPTRSPLGLRPNRGVALVTEKCSVCGASVKKENLGGHYDRVHPKRSGSVNAESKTVTYSGQSSIFRKSHRRRNLLVLSLVALAVIGVAFAAASYDRGEAPESSYDDDFFGRRTSV